MDQTARARLFQQMHLGPEILVIANAWDAASARLRGCGHACGRQCEDCIQPRYPDNEFIPREVLLAATLLRSRVLRAGLDKSG